MNDVDKIQEIENLLNNQLSPTEADAFKQRMQQNPSFASEVAVHRAVINSIEQHGRMDLKKHLQNVEKRLALAEEAPVVPLHKRNTTLRWVASIAASILVLLVAFLWLKAPSDNERIFAHYYKPYPNVIASIARGEPAKDEKAEAMLAYENQDYSSALRQLEQLNQKHPNELGIALYAGLSAIQVGKTHEAERYFNKVLQHTGNNPYTQQARWYLALVYIKNKENKKAKLHLEALANTPNAYRDNARGVLDELK